MTTGNRQPRQANTEHDNAEKPQRNTVQRRVILEELRRTEKHPTAGELYRVVRKRLPKISLGTVYRNLEILVQAGQICKMTGDGKEARFDPIMEQHYHIRCVSCGRIDDLENPPEVRLDDQAPRQEGWRVVDHKVEFMGTCPDCLTQNEEQNRKSINASRSNPAS